MLETKDSVGWSYAGQLGLRFQALRAYCECSRIYREINPAAAVSFIPKIRIDHYYPWLFAEDFPLSNRILRTLAIGNVLFSDAVLGSLNALHQGGIAVEAAQAPVSQALIERAIRQLDSLTGNDICFQKQRGALLDEQLAAMATERRLIADESLLSDVEAEQHAQRKAAYLRITILALGKLSGQPDRAGVIMQAQDQMSVALDLYNALLYWRRDIRQYRANRVLSRMRECGCDFADPGQIGRALYETESCNLIFERILNACCIAGGFPYHSQAFRSVIQWMMARIRRLQADFAALRQRVYYGAA